MLIRQTSSIIKDMKIEQKNKWRKTEIVKLDTSLDSGIYRDLMKNLNTSSTPFDLTSYVDLEFSV